MRMKFTCPITHLLTILVLQISQIQFSRVFEMSTPMLEVINDLVDRLNAEFKKAFDVLYDLVL